LERKRQKSIARRKSACFYQLLRKGIRFIPLGRYAVAVKLMSLPSLKGTILPVEKGQWLLFPRGPSTWPPLGLKEPHVRYHLEALFKNADAFIDCGANLGWYSFLASRYGGIKNLVAVEPVYQSVRYLKIIKQLNQIKNLTLIKGCISDHDGSVFFPSSKKRFFEMGCVEPTMNGGSGCLLAESPSYTLQSIVDMLPASLNQICMKIDVEGHEKAVLNSVSRETLTQRIRSTIVEVHLYKFPKPEDELEEIYEILSLIGKPQFLLSPQLMPFYARFRCHLSGRYPISKLQLPSILKLIRRGKISELHVLVERKVT